jgi:hypothetical protein
MSAIELGPVELDLDGNLREPMLHAVDPERGFPWALCGHRCKEAVFYLKDPERELDCVVCVDLWRRRGGR